MRHYCSRARSDEERSTAGSLLPLTVGVSDRPLRVTPGVHLATLRHFDSVLPGMGQNSPLIPCERRPAEMEISENQEVTFASRFGYRDYDRPFLRYFGDTPRF